MDRAEAERITELICTEEASYDLETKGGYAAFKEKVINILMEETQSFSEKMKAAEEARKKAEEEVAELRKQLDSITDPEERR